jgi:transglutaminase-like putative cysteine protease
MSFVVALLVLKREGSWVVMSLVSFFGIFAIFISMYGSFNLSGLSRLKLFLELIIYLLIFAVSLQRLTREVNFYLLVSPMLLLALSLFFFHSIVMLGYVVFEIFVLLWVILSYRMEGSIEESMKMAGSIFVFSLPWVVVLFIFFPRISFEHASYGFKGEGERRMGHDGTMFLDNNALLVPSDKIVMEVGFKEKIPTTTQLYFRGSILYRDQKDHWSPLPTYIRRPYRQEIESLSRSIEYKVTLYPTHKRWLYMIDTPYNIEMDNHRVSIDPDFITTTTENIDEPIYYIATSALSYKMSTKIDNFTLQTSLEVDSSSNPKSWSVANEIRESIVDPKERVDRLIAFFRQSSLTYTLHPKALDLNNSTDSFLFDSKLGYCVHFASAFANMARMVEIPSRVVTGYRADLSNSINNYLAIKERDAHAWVELFIDKRWVRYETTAWASKMDRETQKLLNPKSTRDNSKLNLYLMYIKYQVETWILHYSHLRQLQLLERARKDPIFIAKFVGSILLIILLSYMMIGYFRRPICEDRVICMMSSLLERLEREECYREREETMHSFLVRCSSRYGELLEIDRVYEAIRYGGDSSSKTFKRLEEMIGEFRG